MTQITATEMDERLSVVHLNDIAFVGSTLVAGLREAGIAAELWTPATPGADWRYPWKAASLPLRAGLLAATGARLRTHRPDIVHIHYATQALPGILAGRPFIIHCHGSDIRGVRPTSARGRALRALMERAALVYVATPDLLEHARHLRPDAQWMPNPVDTTLFTPGGEPDRDVLIGTRLSAIKGVDTAIAVVEALRAARPETTFTVVDHGPELRRMLDAAGPIASVVRPVPHAEMPALFRRHRIAIGQFALGVLSQYELESLACGVPVTVHFDSAGVYDEPPPIIQGQSAEEIAGAIGALLDDEPARAARAGASRSWVVARHDLGLTARQHRDAYRRLIG